MAIQRGVRSDTNENMSFSESLKAFAESELGSFKAPQQVYILDELPKGPSGKVQRLKLAELLN